VVVVDFAITTACHTNQMGCTRISPFDRFKLCGVRSIPHPMDQLTLTKSCFGGAWVPRFSLQRTQYTHTATL
jgi:hypothetical protein